MRVTGGLLKNMELTSPKGSKTRPTSSKVREALMSMLLPWLDGAKVVDLFAGSGSFGMECASRGANSIIFAERDFSAISAIKKNMQKAESLLKDCDFSVKKIDLVKSIGLLGNKASDGDIVWADPPYDIVVMWLDIYLENPNLFPVHDGRFVLEASSKDIDSVTDKLERSPFFDLVKLKKYGDTAIFISERNHHEQ